MAAAKAFCKASAGLFVLLDSWFAFIIRVFLIREKMQRQFDGFLLKRLSFVFVFNYKP